LWGLSSGSESEGHKYQIAWALPYQVITFGVGCNKSLAHVLFKRTESLALCAVFRVLQVGLIKGIFFVFAKGLRAQASARGA
jgi:hypothetical protein